MATPISINVLDQTIKRVSSLEKLASQGLLHDGDGGGTSSGMETRVTKLETHMEYVRSDLAEIKASLSAVANSIDGMKQDVRDTKLAAGEAKLEAHSARAHSAGKATVITTVIGTGAAILGIVLAAMAFGGDRFDSGLNAAAVAEQAANKVLAAQAAKP